MKRKEKSRKWQCILKNSMTEVAVWQSTSDPKAYEARLPASRGRLRRRYSARSVEAAILAAPGHLGLIVPHEEQEVMEIVEAFNAALAESRRGESARRDWTYAVKRFMLWLPGRLRYWHEITRKHLRDYLSTYDGKSATTRRIALQPIRQTSNFMEREYRAPNVAKGLRIGSKNQRPTPRVFLADVLEFLEFLRAEENPLEAGIALQGLAGLQMQEAMRLTWDRVDFDRRLIEISGEVKNEWRKRVIPVCRPVLKALERAKQAKVQSINGQLYPMEWRSYSQSFRRALRRWKPEMPWQCKDLRNCVLQLAQDQGILNNVWEEYVGHSPRGVTERHYLARLGTISRGEDQALEKATALFREQVVKHLEFAIEGQKSQENPTKKAVTP